MKFKYYLFLAKKSFFHKKINIINVLLLAISMTIIVFAFSFSKTFNNIIENQISGNINSHILLIPNHSSTVNLSDVDNISFLTDFSFYIKYVQNENDEDISLIGVPSNYLKISSGKNFSDVTDKQVMICPSRFYLGSDSEVYDEAFLENIQDGKKYVNKSMHLLTQNYDKEYKIIGTYDVNKYTYGEFNVCFTRQSNIVDISNSELEYLKNECDSEKQNCEDISLSNTTVVIVDDVKKIDETKRQIEQKGYIVRYMSEVDTNFLNAITIVLLLLTSIILVVCFIIMILYNNKKVEYNKKNNLIYKAMGYDNKTLIKVNYLEVFILSIISELLCITFCFVIYKIISQNFAVDIKTGFQIYISYLAFIVGFVISLCVSILTVYLSINNNKNTLIEELSDGEI